MWLVAIYIYMYVCMYVRNLGCLVNRNPGRARVQVVPQQWLSNTTAPGVAPDDRRRLDLVIYGASPMGGALCCDADPNGPAATLHGGARRRHVASCRAAQANHLPRAQLERSAAAPRARLRDRWAVERDGAAARQRLGARPSPTGPAGTGSSSHFRLD